MTLSNHKISIYIAGIKAVIEAVNLNWY